MDQTDQKKKKIAYICEGSCQAQITQQQYDKGLTKCGEKSCTFFGRPFKKVEDFSEKG